MEPDRNLFLAMAWYVMEKDTIAMGTKTLVQVNDPVLPPWGDLFDASGQPTQVFEIWRKEQGPTQTNSYNKFANSLENCFLKNPVESNDDALYIVFMFCNLLKAKGTLPSHPKLLELSILYSKAHPEDKTGKLFNFKHLCYAKYLTERKKDELHKVDTNSRQSFGKLFDLLELSKAIYLVNKFKEAMAYAHGFQKRKVIALKRLVLSFVEYRNSSEAVEEAALALREELDLLRRPDAFKFFPSLGYQGIADEIRQIEETLKQVGDEEKDAGPLPKRIKRK